MSRDDPDPDRHLWVVMPPERYTRMNADALAEIINTLKDKNDRAWGRSQEQLAERSRKRRPR